MKTPYATLLATAVLAIGVALPAQADPPPWAPAHGYRDKHEHEHEREVVRVREYRYVYYPAQQVYYAPEQRMWFWMNGGNWQFGASLPMQYQVYSSSGVQVMLGSSRPYVEHAYVEETYGRPWREQHGGRHGKHKG